MFVLNTVADVESKMNDPLAVPPSENVTFSSVNTTRSAPAAVAPPSNSMHAAMIANAFRLMPQHQAAASALSFDLKDKCLLPSLPIRADERRRTKRSDRVKHDPNSGLAVGPRRSGL